MALYFKTKSPQNLLIQFKKAIQEGRVSNWSCDSDGDFTHTDDQWKHKAWFRPSVEENTLAFYILKPKDVNITTRIYAIYHGRFVTSMLNHCDKLFTESIATALPKGRDRVSARSTTLENQS